MFKLLAIIVLIIYLFMNKMNIVKEFDAYLNSNVPVLYPEQVENTIGNFRTRLNESLDLSGDWYVSLQSIQYRKSWNNIRDHQKLYIVDKQKIIKEINEVFPKGNYQNPHEITALLNEIYRDHVLSDTKLKSPPVFEYLNYSNRIRIKLGQKKSADPTDIIYPKLSPFLAKFLGLADSRGQQYPDIDLVTKLKTEYEFVENRIMKNKNQTNLSSGTSSTNVTINPSVSYSTNYNYFEGFSDVTLHGPIDTLYVYCSLIEPVIVGNIRAQLLRPVAVPSDKLYGETCSANFTVNTGYKRLKSLSQVDEVEIDIKDDTGRTVDFNFGKVLLTLHFIKKENHGFI